MTRSRDIAEVRVGSEQFRRRVGGVAEAVIGARGDTRRLQAVLEGSDVPVVIVDSRRRYLDVNRAARLWFRLSLEQMRTYATDDLAPADQLGTIEREWGRLIKTGCVAGPYLAAKPDHSRVELVYCALAHVLPGQHVIIFAPADWPEDELGVTEDDGLDPSVSLTRREVEVLALAADGLSAPELARALGVSSSTVRTHLKNIYERLDAPNRSAAVAKSMRLGVIE
jgi:DNA-binding CsgD family transcriptional regulator